MRLSGVARKKIQKRASEAVAFSLTDTEFGERSGLIQQTGTRPETILVRI